MASSRDTRPSRKTEPFLRYAPRTEAHSKESSTGIRFGLSSCPLEFQPPARKPFGRAPHCSWRSSVWRRSRLAPSRTGLAIIPAAWHPRRLLTFVPMVRGLPKLRSALRRRLRATLLRLRQRCASMERSLRRLRFVRARFARMVQEFPPARFARSLWAPCWRVCSGIEKRSLAPHQDAADANGSYLVFADLPAGLKSSRHSGIFRLQAPDPRRTQPPAARPVASPATSRSLVSSAFCRRPVRE
jgi:hypothetical protein